MSRKRGGGLSSGDVGRRYGKYDLDRVGFFDDVPAGPFDLHRGPVIFREDTVKKRQILGGPPKVLFEKKFERIFAGEPLAEVRRNEVDRRLRDEKRKKKKKIHVMLPTSPSKKHSTPGDWYGCFDKPSYFSALLKMETKKKPPALPNMKIKPNPRGGPGYVNICFSPYPTYYEHYDHTAEGILRKKVRRVGRFLTSSATRDYFPPNPYKDEYPGPTYVPRPDKIARRPPQEMRFLFPFPKAPGGSHAGCFSKFPEHMSDPYTREKDKIVALKFILGGPSTRSKYTSSIIEQITRVSCNERNYADYRERVYPPAPRRPDKEENCSFARGISRI